VAAAEAKEATDLKVNAEAAEVVVAVIVPRVNAVSVPKVKNAVVVNAAAVEVVAEAPDHELQFPMVKTDPLLNVLNAVDSAEDSRANLVRNTMASIVEMALAVETAESGETVTAEVAGATKSQDQRTATLLQLKARQLPLKQSPSASEESASPEKKSRLKPQLKRKKSASLLMITSKRNRLSPKVSSRSKK
jgi:hypothetical protein